MRFTSHQIELAAINHQDRILEVMAAEIMTLPLPVKASGGVRANRAADPNRCYFVSCMGMGTKSLDDHLARQFALPDATVSKRVSQRQVLVENRIS